MKKNESLSEEVLEKVSAGVISPSEITQDLIYFGKPENTNVKFKILTSTASQEWTELGGNTEVPPLKTESHDLHAISENALQNPSNPHKRRIP